jgi:hypothetical protein
VRSVERRKRVLNKGAQIMKKLLSMFVMQERTVCRPRTVNPFAPGVMAISSATRLYGTAHTRLSFLLPMRSQVTDFMVRSLRKTK